MHVHTYRSTNAPWTRVASLILPVDAHGVHTGRFDLFIVPTRDPVDRTVSSFNWMHPYGGSPQFQLSTIIDPPSLDLATVFNCFNRSVGSRPNAVTSWGESLDTADPCGIASRACLHREAANCKSFTMGYQHVLATSLSNGRTGDAPSTARSREAGDVISRLRWLRAQSGGRAHAITVDVDAFDADIARTFEWLCLPQLAEYPSVNDEYPRKADQAISLEAHSRISMHTVAEYSALIELKALSVANGTL